MTRIQKLNKLSNAIRRYKGLFRWVTKDDQQTKHWIHAPQPKAAVDIVKWSDALGLGDDILIKVDSVQTTAEYEKFIRELYALPPAFPKKR